MLWATHWIFVALYAGAPLFAFLRTFFKRTGLYRFDRSYLMTWIAGIAFAVALNLVYAVAAGARVIPQEVILASYLGAAMLFLLKGFDVLLRMVVRRVFRVGPFARPSARYARSRLFGATVVRTSILILIVLPYVMATIMTYRPKVKPLSTPLDQFQQSFQPIQFRSTDGLLIDAWWMPTPLATDRSRKTVLVCHGLGANKSNQLSLARPFVDGGYNVLIFDFRAHGGSDGHLSTFGDCERKDVLGAVRWLRSQASPRATKIFGVGASMGGAALVAAAADESVEGRSIDAIALYGTYDSLGLLTRDIARQYFIPPFSWLLPNIGLPLASVQSGRPLASFSPGDLIAQVWPRPVLIIHGTRDEIIPFERGRHLFDSAVQPKRRLWIDSGDHNRILGNQRAADAVMEFFDTATPRMVL